MKTNQTHNNFRFIRLLTAATFYFVLVMPEFSLAISSQQIHELGITVRQPEHSDLATSCIAQPPVDAPFCHGVVVEAVNQESPMRDEGIQVGDLIFYVNHEYIADTTQLIGALDNVENDVPVRFMFRRGDYFHLLRVTLSESHNSARTRYHYGLEEPVANNSKPSGPTDEVIVTDVPNTAYKRFSYPDGTLRFTRYDNGTAVGLEFVFPSDGTYAMNGYKEGVRATDDATEEQRRALEYYALFKAAEQAIPEVVSLLIERGADVNSENKYGQTPLFDAYPTTTDTGEFTENHYAVIGLLLKAGADPNHRQDMMNMTAEENHYYMLGVINRVTTHVREHQNKEQERLAREAAQRAEERRERIAQREAEDRAYRRQQSDAIANGIMQGLNRGLSDYNNSMNSGYSSGSYANSGSTRAYNSTASSGSSQSGDKPFKMLKWEGNKNNSGYGTECGKVCIDDPAGAENNR